MRIVVLVLLFVVVALGLTFSVLNAAPVKLNYYFGTVSTPLALMLVLALAVGALLGAVAGMGRILRLRHEVSKLRREVELKEQEVMNLRNIPIRDVH